jgi:UDP-N-acetylmuramoylalanine--D-glutamate ligase
MLAVTGSKGKSSVVKLVADALDGVPCGNYGKPLCAVCMETSASHLKWAVVEVSSFQMETTRLPPETFEAAAVLNLQEDHLDRHGSVAVYHGLKRKLLDFARVKIMGTDPKIMGTDPNRTVGTDPDDRRMDLSLFSKSYFDNPILRDNGLCAVSLLRAAGVSNETIRAAFSRFEPLPHRMQTVGVFDGVTWIDDSKATSIAALVAGVTMAASRFSGSVPKIHQGSVPKIHLIAGGLPKGDDPRVANASLARWVKRVYLIGQSASLLEAAWKDVVSCVRCGTLEQAVDAATSAADAGECLLLSPGAASFDQFKSYGERGDRFASLGRNA